MKKSFVFVWLVLGSTANAFHQKIRARLSPSRMLSMRSEDKNEYILSKITKTIAAAAAFTSLSSSAVNAADYTPATTPPTLSPQLVTKQSIKAGTPEKWIYSKFLDNVEKNDVEKVTFSPDGKKAVGVNADGDRFTVDIPNDPNLLSFLVQHKVEINVAPINANGGTGAEAATVVVPEGDLKLFEYFEVITPFFLEQSQPSLLVVVPWHGLHLLCYRAVVCCAI